MAINGTFTLLFLMHELAFFRMLGLISIFKIVKLENRQKLSNILGVKMVVLKKES